MKKFFTLVTVLFVLFFWNCSSSQQKECECPPSAESQDASKSQQPAESSTPAEKSETATRSGEAEQSKTEDSKSGEAEQSKPSDTATTTKPAESKPTATGSDSTKSGEAEQASETTASSQSGSYPDPKTPIAQKPLNTASSILGGSGEAASATQPAATREGSGESQAPSDETSRDQIRKIDRESDYVIPPQFVPVKGTQSNNQTTPAPQGAGGSFSLNCEDYNEDTKSIVCRGKSASLKGDTVLEFDARQFKKLFMGFDLTLRSGEIEVQIPGKDPVKATPSKPFIYLGEVQSNNNKVQVRVKADPQEAKEIDYIVRLFYHGQG